MQQALGVRANFTATSNLRNIFTFPSGDPARGAGLQAVWLDRPGARRGGVHLEDPVVAREAGVAVVRGLDELPALLEAV